MWGAPGIILLLATVSLAGCGAEDSQQAAVAAEPIRVSLPDLERAFDDNEVGAMATYGGRPLLVSAEISSVQLDTDNKVRLALKTVFMMPVNAHLNDDQRDRSGRLREGDSVELQCQALDEFMGKPVLERCAIISPA